MGDGYNAVRLHIVWATFDRLPLLTPEVQSIVYAEIEAAARRVGSRVEAIGGIEDHVHVLVRFPTTVSIADLVKEMKGSSSRIISRRMPEILFRWQGTYGVFPVSPAAAPRVTAYIARQQEHHSSGDSLIPTLERTTAPTSPSSR